MCRNPSNLSLSPFSEVSFLCETLSPQRMELIVSPITVASIRASIPLSIAFKDFISRSCEICISLQAPDYSKEKVLIYKSESGSNLQLSIKGKPGFCLAALQNLAGSAREHSQTNSPIDIFKARVAEMHHWRLKTPLSDFFQPREELKFDISGNSWRKESIFILWSSESGAKFSVVVKGKPGFCQLVAAQLQSCAPLIMNLVSKILAG